jgi:hypothetical protein
MANIPDTFLRLGESPSFFNPLWVLASELKSFVYLSIPEIIKEKRLSAGDEISFHKGLKKHQRRKKKEGEKNSTGFHDLYSLLGVYLNSNDKDKVPNNF